MITFIHIHKIRPAGVFFLHELKQNHYLIKTASLRLVNLELWYHLTYARYVDRVYVCCFRFRCTFLLSAPVNRLIIVKQSNLAVVQKNRRTEKRNRKATNNDNNKNTNTVTALIQGSFAYILLCACIHRSKWILVGATVYKWLSSAGYHRPQHTWQ